MLDGLDKNSMHMCVEVWRYLTTLKCNEKENLAIKNSLSLLLVAFLPLNYSDQMHSKYFF